MRPSRRLPAARPAAPLVALGPLAAFGTALGMALGTAPAARAQAAPGGVPPAPWERRSPVHFAAGGGGIFQSSGGRAAGQLGDGSGFDVFGSLGVSSLALGVGYQHLRHSQGGAESGRATYHGVFVEPRFSTASFRNFTPYVNARVGFLRATGPLANAAGDRSVTSLAAGLGTLVWLAPGVSLDLGGMYSDARAGSRAGAVFGGPGRGVMLRAGAVLGFDRWGR